MFNTKYGAGPASYNDKSNVFDVAVAVVSTLLFHNN